MELAQEVLKLSTADVSRFVTLRDRLSDTAFNMADTPFPGWDKFKRTDFKYTLYHVEPPKHLFLIGRSWQVLNAAVSISFGGTVSPTADGFRLSELLAQQVVLRHRAIVIGGGVIGVDMAAHLGALDAKGITVAVLANPVTLGLHPYEPKRTFLEEGILQQGGLLVSEYDSPSDDLNERLLQRDRVITALSDFVAAFITTVPVFVTGGLALYLFGAIGMQGIALIQQNKVDLFDPLQLAIGATIMVVGIGGNIGFPGGFLPIVIPGFPNGLPAIATAALVGIGMHLAFSMWKPRDPSWGPQQVPSVQLEAPHENLDPVREK